MLKNILGGLIFVVAVFALVNVIGNVMMNPATEAPAEAPTKAAPATPSAAAAPRIVAAALVGDAKAGKNIFRKKCMGCHTVGKEDPSRTGPNLWAIIGKEKGIAKGYRYSKPMRALGGVWTEADLMSFMAGPRTFLRDTKMTFAGLKKEKDRVNVIAYLQTLKD